MDVRLNLVLSSPFLSINKINFILGVDGNPELFWSGFAKLVFARSKRNTAILLTLSLPVMTTT